jgi:hypothetical protein
MCVARNTYAIPGVEFWSAYFFSGNTQVCVGISLNRSAIPKGRYILHHTENLGSSATICNLSFGFSFSRLQGWWQPKTLNQVPKLQDELRYARCIECI